MAANSIVVATDGSRESVLAVEWAALEASRRGAPLRIVSTSAMPPRMRPAYGSQETVADALQAASVQALATAASRAAEVAPNVPVQTDLLSGAPARVITEAASSASMLVVGARGAGGFTAMILGSVSRYAAMHAACPVVVAQEESLRCTSRSPLVSATLTRRSARCSSHSTKRPCAARACAPSTPGTGCRSCGRSGCRGSPHRGDERDRATAVRPGGHLRGVRPPAR